MRSRELTSQPIRWGFTAALMIFALRFAVGWHFFSSGAEKLKNPNFRSAYFLEEAVGPGASFFHRLVPDALGKQRLDLDGRRKSWFNFKDALVARVDGDEDKDHRATAVLEEHLKKFDYFTAEYGSDIEQHLLEVQRYEDATNDPNLLGMDTGRNWLKKKRSELKSACRGWISDLSALEKAYWTDLIAAVEIDPATVDAPPDPSEKGWIDHSVTWMLLLVGASLMLGLMTPLAAAVGACFLLTVMLTQPFWISNAELSYFPYQLVELVALLFLAVVGAGRCGGLDYFFSARRWGREAKAAGN
jgi:uncharacterized membrane protein YphA (DoxX/SURF4 family)